MQSNHSCRWPWRVLACLTLSGCAPLGAASVPPMPQASGGPSVDAAGKPASPPLAGSAARTRVAPEAPAPSATQPSAAPVARSGSRAAGPIDPDAPRLRLSDGRELVLSGSDTVALPAGLSGLVSLMVPDRVPATLEVPAGLAAMHPQAIANAPEPSGLAVLEGRSAPGAAVAYHAPGRAAYAGTFADADGAYRLEIPLDGQESGVLLARDAQSTPMLALGAVTIRAGETTAAPALSLVGPTGETAAPQAPAGWQLEGGWLSAVPDAAPAPWRVSVLTRESGQALPTYALSGFALVATHAAVSADARAGGLLSGPTEAGWLKAPDLSGLPERLAGGAAIAWPAVSGAALYTLRLSAPGQPRAVWEAACVTPRLVVPEGLALDQPGLTLELTAWDVPEVTLYSVAALRALRLPAGPAGLGGRMSWARRAVGPSAK